MKTRKSLTSGNGDNSRDSNKHVQMETAKHSDLLLYGKATDANLREKLSNELLAISLKFRDTDFSGFRKK